MAIEFEKTVYPGSMDPFWRQEVRMLPGGFKPLHDVPVGEVVHRASFVHVNFDDMTAALVKVGKVLDGGTTSKPRVSKRNNFFVGDTIMKLGKTDLAVTVKAVDHTNPEYDVLELSAALTSLAKDDFIQEAVEEGTEENKTIKPKYVANMVLGNDFESRKGGLPTFDVAWSAMILKDVCTPFPASWLTENSPCLATNHHLMFIKQ